jgi:lysophospholipase L1-like esterase
MKPTYNFLALGDSYTFGENVDASLTFPAQLIQLVKKLDYKVSRLKVIARTGWTTADLLQAIQEGADTTTYDFVFLLIGVNNQYEGGNRDQYSRDYKKLLSLAIDFAGGRPGGVFVLSIPDYGYTPFGQDRQSIISQEIDLFNKINKEEALNAAVNYIDITGISRKGSEDGTLIASDGLHPSGKMYGMWAQEIIAHVLPYLDPS